MQKPIQTHNEPRSDRSERLKAAIVEYLGCTEEQYTALQYNEGRKYLKYYVADDKVASERLNRSKTFWNWWKNHWTNRDETFMCLTEKCPVKDPQIRLQLYLQYNEGKDLAASIHPNSVVLNDTYATMIDEFINEEKQSA